MDKQTIFQDIRLILNETFEIDPAGVTLASLLYEDLDLDSIDAIDLVVKIQDRTGQKVKPDHFKAARSVEDVVNIIADFFPA